MPQHNPFPGLLGELCSNCQDAPLQFPYPFYDLDTSCIDVTTHFFRLNDTMGAHLVGEHACQKPHYMT